MRNKAQMIAWSDAWWLEADKAWFVDGMRNMLFSVDLDTGECESVTCIPDSDECTFRLTPVCLKCGRDIFCIPGFGKSIWVYNLDDNTFTEIEINKLERHQLGSQFWTFGDLIFIVAANWNKVIEVSISQKAITNYYIICENDSIFGSVLVGSNIYAVSSGFGRIYQFDLSTKKVNTYLLPVSGKKLFTICFDGEKFWLSGYQKEVYIWDKEKNDLTTIDGFPNNFENCDFTSNTDRKAECTTDSYELPAFNRSVAVGKYIWFIPIKADKIIYINKENSVLSVFELDGENETKENNALGIANYLLEYVKDDRYIGLFSAKNSRFLEIDVKQLTYQWKEYYLSDKCLQQYCEPCKGVYHEGGDPLHSQAYRKSIGTAGYKTNSIDIINVGMKIHTRLMEDIQ